MLNIFENSKPLLLGSLFDAVSGMLQKVPDVSFERLPRMADYYRYAAAASDFLGYGIDNFVQAYAKNVDYQNQETIEASSLIQCILIFMKERESYRGTATALYLQLKDIAFRFDMIHGFPKGATWLWKRIQEYMATMVSIGFEAERSRDSSSRYISIRKTESYNRELNESIPNLVDADQQVFTDHLDRSHAQIPECV